MLSRHTSLHCLALHCIAEVCSAEPHPQALSLHPFVLPWAASLVSEGKVSELDRLILQALRTLFNVAHRLHHLLGLAWVLVLDILNTLDRMLMSPRTTTQVQAMQVHPIL